MIIPLLLLLAFSIWSWWTVFYIRRLEHEVEDLRCTNWDLDQWLQESQEEAAWYKLYAKQLEEQGRTTSELMTPEFEVGEECLYLDHRTGVTYPAVVRLKAYVVEPLAGPDDMQRLLVPTRKLEGAE